MRKAKATAQNPNRNRRAAAGTARTFSPDTGADRVLTPWSPDLHAAIDDEVDPGHVRALVRREEQRGVRHVLRLAEAAEERPVDHLACESTFAVVQVRTRRAALDQAGRDRVDADPVLASLERELTGHADDPRLVGRVRERCEALEAELTVQRGHVHNHAAALLQMRPRRPREVEDQVDLVAAGAVP